jgi:putative protease
MSPKDLNTLPFLDKIVEAGVKILKIEGRGRSPEYVKSVASAYHHALLAIEDGSFNDKHIEKAEKKLKSVFNRGFWDGYYLGANLGAWSGTYGSSATKRKVYVGKGMNYFSKIGVAEFLVESGTLVVGDEIIITGPTTGVVEGTVQEIRVELQNVDKAQKGVFCSIPVSTKIRRADKLYKIVEVSKPAT